MDGMMWPPDFFDPLSGLGVPTGKGRGARQKPKARRGRSGYSAPHYLPLVEEDGLLLTPPTVPEAGPFAAVAASSPGEPTPETSETFRRAFAGVWVCVPRCDRKRLLSYWREEPFPALYGEPEPAHRPVILLMDNGVDDPMCERFGHVLLFPAALAAGEPQRLTEAIVSLLLQTYRQASRDHWGLVLKEIEEPLERWERRHGNASSADRAAKIAKLEATYLRKHRAEVAQLAARWRFEAPKLAQG